MDHYSKQNKCFQVAMDQFESPEARAAGIFKRMDVNSDGRVTRQEFVKTCLEDQVSNLKTLLKRSLNYNLVYKRCMDHFL